jgi:hypothetical protein
MEMEISSSVYTSISEATNALSAVGSYIREFSLTGGVSSESSTKKQIETLDSSSQIKFTLLNGDFMPTWLTLSEFLAGLPDWINSIKNKPGLATIPNFSQSMALWDIVAKIDPEFAGEIFREYVEQAGGVALSLDTQFGGWLKTVEFGPGESIYRFTPPVKSLVQLLAVAGPGGSEGDHFVQHDEFLNVQRYWNWGEGGGAPGGFFLSFYCQNPIELNLKVGGPGRSGTNTKSYNLTDHAGGAGDSGGDTEATFDLDGITVKATAQGGYGGGRPHYTATAALEPAGGFPEMLEWTAVTGSMVKGFNLGETGKIMVRILDLE